ncbi:MAG: sugar phosphate isomerase/epimerase [Ruthenibacterium sp.]
MDKRIGAQLFTVRAHTQTLEQFEQSLRQISRIGYKAVQLSGIGPFTATQIRDACNRNGLVPICTHRSWDELCNHLDDSIQFHKEIGCDIAGIGAIPNLRDGFTWTDVVKFVDKMNVINRKFQENGICFAYHNHDAEFVKFEGVRAIDYILEYGEFDFIVDVYWVACAGVDPARFIRRLGKRAKVIHFKDLSVVPKGKAQQMTEVMEGNLDWDSIIDASEQAGARWAVVEQDICPNDPFDSLQISYHNLLKKGFY